jgi:hypothetical protein
MQHLSGSLLDIVMSVQRLEDKLDLLSRGNSERRTASPASPQGTPVTLAAAGRPMPANRRSRSRGDASESSFEGLKWAKASVAGAEKEAAKRIKATPDLRGTDSRVRLSPSRGNQPEVYTRAARAPAQDKRSPELVAAAQRKAPDPARSTDMPMEVIRPVRRQEAIVRDANTRPPDVPEAMQALMDSKLGDIMRKLERISVAVGVKVGSQEGDDEEDRKRLKEKLKIAIELDRRARVRTIVSSREMWLEYIFGICSPDKRVGKRGSRYFT